MNRLLPLLTLIGCVTETGNPELNVELRVSGTSTDERVAVDAVPELEVLGAYVIVDDVRLVEAEGCDTPTEIEHEAEGPFPVDLLATPTLVEIPAVSTEYCRLRVRLDRADGTPSGFPSGMDDHAVYIEGTRADGVPFVLRSREKFEVDLRSESAPFSVEEGREQLVLAFDLGGWLAGLDLAGASPGGDGTVRVDEDNNESILEDFEERVEGMLELYEDDDGDGEVDDDDDPLTD